MLHLRVVYTYVRIPDSDPIYEKCWRVAIYNADNEFMDFDQFNHSSKASATKRAEFLSAKFADAFTLDY